MIKQKRADREGNEGEKRNQAGILLTAIFAACILAVLAAPAAAQHGSIKLLAVSEGPAGLEGSVATLELDVQKGSGRVFIDTFPTAKIDTQLSTRFAKDMACKYLNLDCSNLDFFYTIRADSPIVGGPSAGAAVTTLTISLLKGIELDDDVVITGTINSGGLIGTVGGIKEKIDAAAGADLKKALIPETSRYVEENNKTLDMVKYGLDKGIKVAEVGSIDEVLSHYTGKDYNLTPKRVKIKPMYEDTMKGLAEGLCERSTQLKKEVQNFRIKNISLVDNDFADTKNKADNLTEEGRAAFEDERYYSSASYCFGANVKYKSLLYRLKDPSEGEYIRIMSDLQMNITSLESELEGFEIRTITDLQAYMIVADRIEEAKDYLNRSRINLRHNSTQLPLNMAFAGERLQSAVSWSTFMGQKGSKFRISETELMRSCLNKISEAEERYNYVNYLFRGAMNDVGRELQSTKGAYKKGDYALCLYEAALTKARIGVVSSSIGVKEENLDKLLERKLQAARTSVINQQESGIYPILSYSYYEYAKSLKERDIYSALLYAEHALELSNMDIYFEPEKATVDIERSGDATIFFSGMAIGIMLSVLVFFIERRKKMFSMPTPKHKRIKFKFKKK